MLTALSLVQVLNVESLMAVTDLMMEKTINN